MQIYLARPYIVKFKRILDEFKILDFENILHIRMLHNSCIWAYENHLIIQWSSLVWVRVLFFYDGLIDHLQKILSLQYSIQDHDKDKLLKSINARCILSPEIRPQAHRNHQTLLWLRLNRLYCDALHLLLYNAIYLSTLYPNHYHNSNQNEQRTLYHSSRLLRRHDVCSSS